ncbi:MAG TPA: ATP-binding cassette domain-containing protein [Balneolaceae bacterium]|nr:ATP-binding cassette domain-containing protein [Balneolaceae bacterium]
MNNISIRVEGLYKRFGAQAVLRNISFIHKNGILGIEGPNGSGKSTLMKCMAGLNSPTKGSVIWKKDGDEIKFTAFRNHLGYAAPYINLYDELTCFENLRFLLDLRNIKPSNSRINGFLRQVNMQSFSSHIFRNLSTGQRQRMRIAAALVPNPEVLFLDEPGSNLDDQGHRMIQEVVASFNQADKPVIIASNDKRELELCDKIFSVEKERFKHGHSRSDKNETKNF